MRLPIPIFFTVVALLVGCSTTGKGSLSFQCPDGWKIDHGTSGGLELYTATDKTPDDGLLMISPWPAPSRPEEIPALVKKLAEGFREQVKKSSEIALASDDYEMEHFAEDRCEGSYAVFQIRSGGTNGVQAMFMMSVEGSIWSGQFTGQSEAWKQALAVLKSAKKSG